MSFAEQPRNTPDAGGNKFDPSKRAFVTSEGKFTHDPLKAAPSTSFEKPRRPAVPSAESLIASHSKNLMSSAKSYEKNLMISPEQRAMEGTQFGMPIEERVRGLKQQHEELERLAMEYTQEAQTLTDGLSAMERGEAPHPEFRSRVESLLTSAAKELQTARGEDQQIQKKVPGYTSPRTEKAIGALSAYQQLLDRLDTSKRG